MDEPFGLCIGVLAAFSSSVPQLFMPLFGFQCHEAFSSFAVSLVAAIDCHYGLALFMRTEVKRLESIHFGSRLV